MVFECPKCQDEKQIKIITLGGDNFFSISCIKCNIRSKSTDRQNCINRWDSYDFEPINIAFGCMDTKKAENSGIYDESGVEKFNVNILIRQLEAFSTRLHNLENLNGKLRFDLGGVKTDLKAIKAAVELSKGRNQHMAKLTTKARNKLSRLSKKEEKIEAEMNKAVHRKPKKAVRSKRK